jgi:hypothetical protein
MTRTLKNTMSLVLALVLCLGTFVAFPLTAKAASVTWNDIKYGEITGGILFHNTDGYKVTAPYNGYQFSITVDNIIGHTPNNGSVSKGTAAVSLNKGDIVVLEVARFEALYANGTIKSLSKQQYDAKYAELTSLAVKTVTFYEYDKDGKVTKLGTIGRYISNNYDFSKVVDMAAVLDIQLKSIDKVPNAHMLLPRNNDNKVFSGTALPQEKPVFSESNWAFINGLGNTMTGLYYVNGGHQNFSGIDNFVTFAGFKYLAVVKGDIDTAILIGTEVKNNVDYAKVLKDNLQTVNAANDPGTKDWNVWKNFQYGQIVHTGRYLKQVKNGNEITFVVAKEFKLTADDFANGAIKYSDTNWNEVRVGETVKEGYHVQITDMSIREVQKSDLK